MELISAPNVFTFANINVNEHKITFCWMNFNCLVEKLCEHFKFSVNLHAWEVWLSWLPFYHQVKLWNFKLWLNFEKLTLDESNRKIQQSEVNIREKRLSLLYSHERARDLKTIFLHSSLFMLHRRWRKSGKYVKILWKTPTPENL